MFTLGKLLDPKSTQLDEFLDMYKPMNSLLQPTEYFKRTKLSRGLTQMVTHVEVTIILASFTEIMPVLGLLINRISRACSLVSNLFLSVICLLLCATVSSFLPVKYSIV